MKKSAPRFAELLVLPLVMSAGAALWLWHAHAWDLGNRSPVLNFDSAQYAVAARELGWHGRLATPFALPLELVKQPQPPWPLAVVQPGLVLFEALVFKLIPARGAIAGSDPRGWLTLVLPFCCYLFLGAGVALSVRHLFARWWPDGPPLERIGAALVLGLYFLLDAESQHFAVSGLTELPFTIGVLFALLGLALGAPGKLPLVYGLVLGGAGLFRLNMMWLAPLFAIAGAWSAEPGSRLRTLVLVLAGFALPLAPWWAYKWATFGTPVWDLTRFVVWESVQGRSWDGLFCVANLPSVPHGAEAVSLLASKVVHNLPRLTAALLSGPRGLWLGAIAGWLLLVRPARPLAAAGFVALAATVLGLFAAALSMPWLRFLYPARVLAEPVGLLALAALLTHLTRETLSLTSKRLVYAAIAVLALSWGALGTLRGNDAAENTSRERGVPSSQSITALSIVLSARLVPGEPVMSNLGPILAWQSLHPVLYLADSPEDVAACRRRLDFRTILLVTREGRPTWPHWREIMEHEGVAATVPGLGVIKEERVHTHEGFVVVWLTLGPVEPALASNARR